MRVISQDGTIDVPYEMVVIQRFEEDVYFLNRNLTGVEDLISDIRLAKYSTEAKALKAMEMLREVYVGMPIVMQNGCNGFDLKIPTSNPMSFWTEQDVLLYIKENNLPICSVYGEVVTDYEAMGQCENQMSFADFGIFDKERPLLKTTGCQRTGCVLCGFGCHLEKESRFLRLKETHPKFHNLLYILKNNGVTYAEAIDWVNEHGNMNIKY